MILPGEKCASAQAAPMVEAMAPCTVKPSASSRLVSMRQHRRFAAEQMADPGDVEAEIAIRRRIGQHRDDRARHWNASRQNRRRPARR